VSYRPGAQVGDRVVTWKNFLLVALYQLFVVGVWVWLQEFTGTHNFFLCYKQIARQYNFRKIIINFQIKKYLLLS
jgi:hypothetical protein